MNCPITISVLSILYAAQGKELYSVGPDYNKNIPPSKDMEVEISLFINRVSAVDESKEEISLEVFLQVYWKDERINITTDLGGLEHLELAWEKDQKFWVPDVYIRQLREMKVLSLFQEMTSVRLYPNHTMRISIGATVIIKCDMDFVLYPLDVQKCAVDFSSYKYTKEDMTFLWRSDTPLSFPSDFGGDGYRLPKYVVSFAAEIHKEHIIFYGEGNHSTARLLITMSREIRSHLLESYLPSTLFVIMSWGSFVVMPEVVPGRMVLLVTTLLSLVTMFDTIRNNSPNALELKCIEVWLISCTLFVFFALLEYFIVLFGIRYDKHWRHKPPELEQDENHMSVDRMGRIFQQSRVLPQDGHHNNSNSNDHKDLSPAQDDECQRLSTTTLSSHAQVDGNTEAGREHETGRGNGRRKFQLLTQHVILYVGSQRGTIDQISLALFPLCFILFTITYWISYITESRRRAAV